jgi:hypothetical protein
MRAEEARALQRERQARLDGMIFAVRELASRVTASLAAPEGGDIAALAKMLDDIAELQRQNPPG